MSNLVDEILAVEEQCDRIIEEAGRKAEALKKEAAGRIATEKAESETKLLQAVEELQQQSERTLAAEKNRMARDHAAALQSTESIPQEALARQVQMIVQHLLEA